MEKIRGNLKNLKIGIAIWGLIIVSLIFAFPYFGWAENLKQIKNQIMSLGQQRQQLETQIEGYDNQLKYLEDELVKTDTSIKLNEDELIKIEAELKKQQGYLSENLKALYEDGNKSLFELIFSSKTFSDFVDRTEYLNITNENLKEISDKITLLKKDAQKRRKSLTTLKTIQVLLRASIDNQKTDKVANLIQVEEEERRIRDRFIEKFGTWANTAYCKTEGRVISAKYPIFNFPVNCGYVSQGFGMTEFAGVDNAYRGNIHNGFDVGVETGTEIRSIGNGTVFAKGSSPSGGWGNWIMVKMDKVKIENQEIEFYALYAHMITETMLNVGDKVNSNSLIGWIGGTPYWSPHLHFSLFITPSGWSEQGVGPYPGNAVDPLDYMDIPISTVGTDWDPSYIH